MTSEQAFMPSLGLAAEPIDLAMVARCVAAALQGPEVNPNPRVGSVIVDDAGVVIGVGHHDGAGTPHAEVMALAQAGGRAQGATAYVSLEPCAHHGRTPPCAQALLDAGVARVVYAVADPDARAAGGAQWLAQRGVRVDHIGHPDAEALVRHWAFAVRAGRPWVTWKFAATLDGRVAASDGSSAWVTSEAARADVHALRSRCGAILVGTGTVLADNPTLTARHEDGSLYADQPLRVVVGLRDLPPQAHLSVTGDRAEGTTTDVDASSAGGATAGPPVLEPLHLRTHEVTEVLEELHTRGVHRVLLEGGPTLASALWRAGCVDEVVAYLAPALLGSGASAVGDLGITTMSGIARLDLVETVPVGPDLRITAYPRRTPQED